MKKISNFFTQNILWKLFSLVVAIGLWFVAVSVEDPITTRTYTTNLRIQNIDILEEYGIVILNKDQLKNTSISVRVSSQRSNLSTISTNDVVAYIDMKGINLDDENIGLEPIEAIINVEVNTNHGHEVNIRPVSVLLDLDYIVTQEMPITINKVSYDAPNTISLTPIANPQTVVLTGAKSHIESIGSVVVEVDTENALRTYTTFATPVIYNKEGRDITHKFEINVPTIEVTVPINGYTQIPVLRPNIIGELAQGYTIIDTVYYPQYIEVVGNTEDINAFQSIALGDIDITGKDADTTILINVNDILAQANLAVKSGTPYQIVVDISISNEPITNVSIPISQLNIIGDITNVTFEDNISISLKGEQDILQAIDYSTIEGTIDVENLEAGEHNVPVKLTLPEGVTQVGGTVFTKVTVGSANASDANYLPEKPNDVLYDVPQEESTQ